MRKIITTLAMKNEEIQNFIYSLKQMMQNVEDNSSRVREDLESEFQSLYALLDELKDEMLTKIKQERASRTYELQTQVAACAKALESSEELLEAANQALGTANDHDFVQAAKQIKDSVTMAPAFRLSLKAKVSDNMSHLMVDFTQERRLLQALAFLPVPSTPEIDLAESLVADNCVTLAWRMPDDNSKIDHYVLEYRKTNFEGPPRAKEDQPWMVVEGIKGTEYTLSGLKFDMKYMNFRVRACNKAVAGEFSEPVTLETRAFMFRLDASTCHQNLRVEDLSVEWDATGGKVQGRQGAREGRQGQDGLARQLACQSPKRMPSGRGGRDRFTAESYTVLGDTLIDGDDHYWEVRYDRDSKAFGVGGGISQPGQIRPVGQDLGLLVPPPQQLAAGQLQRQARQQGQGAGRARARLHRRLLQLPRRVPVLLQRQDQAAAPHLQGQVHAAGRERGEGGGGHPGGRAHPPRHHPPRPAPRRAPGAGPRRPLHLLPGQEVRGGPGGGRDHHLAGDGTGLQLTQRLGHPLQAPGEPRQEVGVRLGVRPLQGPEAGPVQSRLAAQTPAQRAAHRGGGLGTPRWDLWVPPPLWVTGWVPALCCPQSLASEGEEEEMPEEEEEEATREGRAPVPEPAAAKKLEERSKKQQCKSLAEPAGTDHGPLGKRLESKPRVPVRYCTLGTRDSARNPQTLVEVTSFAAINKFQPFNVAISSNVLLLLDFHSHLTRSEVVGYLGGRWDTNTQLLTVLRAFPCRTRLGDAEAAGAVEEEICQSLFLRGLSLVGWYHSHPFGPALPSLHDIDAQMDYQLKLQGSGNSFQPCLALICGPYYHGNPGLESKIAPFWVMPPPEQRPNDYGIPMDVEVAYIQDGFLTNDVLQEMTLLVEFYKGAPDLVKFQELWSQDQTYLDKLKGSLASRTPKDQSFTHILEQIYSLLKLSS
ncbi:unnamed protein product [Bubo scandiacus]